MTITRSKKGTLRLYLAIALLVIINIGIIAGCIVIKRYRFDSFSPKEITVYVGNEFTLDSIVAQIQDKVPQSSIDRLRRLSRTKGFPPYVFTGAYRITEDLNVVEVYDLLIAGNASPVRITFHNLRTKEDFARVMSRQLMLSADELLAVMNDEAYCSEKGFAGQFQVFAEGVEFAVDKEILLFRADARGNAAGFVVAEEPEKTDAEFIERVHRTKERGFFIESFAVVADKNRRDA